MRKHDVRKWLHAILDLLPVIVIPVFMIYSHRHTIDNYTITREEPNYVDVYQNVLNGKPNDSSNITFENASYSNGSFTVYSGDWNIDFIVDGVHFNLGDKGLLIFDLEALSDDLMISVDWNIGTWEDNEIYIHEPVHKVFELDNDFGDVVLEYIDFYYSVEGIESLKISNVQFFNLTSIFGSGNEPSFDVFESYLVQDYYNYGSEQIYFGLHDVTYDEPDIGSQMFYCLYNSVDKYFNMGNVFGLSGVYNWFIFNIMNGSSPLALYIVWNVVLYEFVMDLLFLLYGLFMWFIDMVEKLMEKPINSVR